MVAESENREGLGKQLQGPVTHLREVLPEIEDLLGDAPLLYLVQIEGDAPEKCEVLKRIAPLGGRPILPVPRVQHPVTAFNG